MKNNKKGIRLRVRLRRAVAAALTMILLSGELGASGGVYAAQVKNQTGGAKLVTGGADSVTQDKTSVSGNILPGGA